MEHTDGFGRLPHNRVVKHTTEHPENRLRLWNEHTPEVLAYLHDVSCTPHLKSDEERTLGVHARDEGCEVSRVHLMRANLHLVVGIAQNYLGRGLDLEALLIAGNRGLAEAVKAFDPSQATRFSTQAHWHIKQAMRSVLPVCD